MNPKISVLMTAYNVEDYISESISSVLNQTFNNFELIIVNDGSEDKTEKIIKDFMKKDKRIVYIKNPKNKGYDNLFNVINMGLKIAKGKYIARLDADDLCHKHRFQIQYDFLEKNKNLFLVGSSAEVIDKNGIKIDEIIKKPWPSILLKIRIAFSNPLIHSSIMFKNEGFLYPHRDEVFFYFSLLRNGKNLKNLKKKLVKYRINPKGLMANYANLKSNKFQKFYEDK